MKLKIRLTEANHITLIFNNDNTLKWSQCTGATIEWAGQIANKVSYLFPDYKLKFFNFVPSSKGGYDVEAIWERRVLDI